MSTVRCKIKNETNSGNRSGWTKHVTGIDQTKANGYAFLGEFVPGGTDVDLPVGAVIVQKHPEGSVKRGWESGHCYTLGADGDLYETDGKSYRWREDFLSFRDHVAAVLAKQSAPHVTVEQPTPDPRAEAIATIHRLMSEHAISVSEI